jgi:hypothetical protein
LTQPPSVSILRGMPVWPIPTATMASGAMVCVPFLVISLRLCAQITTVLVLILFTSINQLYNSSGNESCNKMGVCQFGAPPSCSDGLLFTDDVCNKSTKSCENPTTDCLASGDPCATDICIESLNGCQFTCGATLDTWWNVSGGVVDKFKITINSGVEPSKTERLGGLLEMESSYELDGDHGRHMMGWLVPPITGEYVFWIAATDTSELWLSTDNNPENMIMLCNPQFAPPGPREWVFSSQKSKRIALVADRAYYIEVRGLFLIHLGTHSFGTPYFRIYEYIMSLLHIIGCMF